ncbi:DUF397 domain-containing protein [Streptomyces sp. MST-110588]|uniref:DUF397 domain-containing protein n=1 Tax=Streptomyces sp. MST-110588 TaxID=2833628 RepID=UPI001F5DAFAF|nr:DUF397 domain-containing protein [Streptomyces sp. MST-110588]UNO41032.1 DUF397 domain-containing protein [Streptomyces sp. MST-110588]
MAEYTFVTSSHSTLSGECVEVAMNNPGEVAVRDSKDPDGPILRFGAAEWAAFQEAVAQDGSIFR